ncbi:MAG: hypothetical protein PHD09_07520 [Candidatus Omnitrophica bacterium]|nr:hypothetical protein [Candidatus Omnitrophota bacterium]
MPKNSSTFNFRKLPSAFLCSVALFFISQALMAGSKSFWHFCYYYSLPMYDDALRLEAQLRLMPPNDNNTRVFLIGSSQAREDFDTELLNQNFKKSGIIFYNLGFSGASPIEIFMIKDKLLKHNPKTIIYVPYIQSFYNDYDLSKVRYYFSPALLPYLMEYLGPESVIRHRGYLIDSIAAENSLIFKYRRSLPRIIFTAVRNFFAKNKISGPKNYAYYENMSDSYFKEKVSQAGSNRYTVDGFTMMNEKLFILFAEEVKTMGIDLIVIDGPTHPMIKEFYKKESELAYNYFFKAQAKRFGFIYLGRDDLPDFNNKDFIDFTHLNNTGRIKFTRFIENYFSKNLLNH